MPEINVMQPFSPKPPRRDVIVPVRLTVDEAAAVDALARRLGMATRAEVLRAGLEVLARQKPGKKSPG
jgi:hypothetical protein